MTLIAPEPAPAAEAKSFLRWEQLASIPDHVGFAGSFAGIHNGALLVGGGANFPGKRPWEGGAKMWHDSLFVLEKTGGKWKGGFRLPRPLGYGVSVTCDQGVVCIGGSNALRQYADVFLLTWENGRIRTTMLPLLPKPCANMCGALLGNTVYVAGGIEKADATNALKTFWSLDLANLEAGWRELAPWPGQGRIFAVAGAQDGSFFIFGGAALKPGADGKVVREWLRDGYRFTPGKGWKRIADLPHAVVAAPCPAPSFGKSELLVLGGDDGKQVNTPPTEHVGFPRDVFAYSTISDTWQEREKLPFALVTTPTANWNGRIIIAGGEARPGVRSTEVWAASPDFEK